MLRSLMSKQDWHRDHGKRVFDTTGPAQRPSVELTHGRGFRSILGIYYGVIRMVAPTPSVMSSVSTRNLGCLSENVNFCVI